jgi:hypothetical protein
MGRHQLSVRSDLRSAEDLPTGGPSSILGSRRGGSIVMRLLAQAHRWLGVCLCLMFTVWFITGAVLLFVPFPSLPDAERLAYSEIVDVSRIAVPPATAITAANGALEQIRLVQVGQHPVYLLAQTDGNIAAVCADSGLSLPSLSPQDAREIAKHFSGIGARQVDGPLSYDQWIVHQSFDPYRPFYRVALQDSAGTVLYVSAKTGEVLQRTRFYERAWNSVGAVIHWIYPTILRQNWQAWNEVVWWLALSGVLTAAGGMVLGIVRLINLKRRGKPGISPFRGWLRWHHVLGLSAGVFLTSWIFSGWLSMDHGRIFSNGEAKSTQIDRFHGISLRAAAQVVSIDRLKEVCPASEIQVAAIGGQTFLVARGANVATSNIYAIKNGNSEEFVGFPEDLVASSVRTAWPHRPIREVSTVDPNDVYAGTDSLRPTTRRFIMGGASPIWVHVDFATGQIVSVMNRSRRVYAWLYYGLHTFNFPVFANNLVLGRVTILALLGAGLSLSLTGAILGLKRIGRTLRLLK